jgi:hypothetical protein
MTEEEEEAVIWQRREEQRLRRLQANQQFDSNIESMSAAAERMAAQLEVPEERMGSYGGFGRPNGYVAAPAPPCF